MTKKRSPEEALQDIDQEILDTKMELEEKYLNFGKEMCEYANSIIYETNGLVDRLIQLKRKKIKFEGGHNNERE